MNIEKICVYNVGFGDCSLLESKNCNLLVDCGGSRDLSERLYLSNDILNSSNGKKLSCIITHFHKDHYNYLSAFQKDSFDAIYAPNFFSEEEIKTQLYALLLMSKTSEVYAMAESMLKWIPNLIDKRILKEDAFVHFVRKGDFIEDKNIEVLWPDMHSIKNAEIIDKFKNALLNAAIHTDISNINQTVLIQLIDDYAKQYAHLMMEFNTVHFGLLLESSHQINNIVENVLELRKRFTLNYKKNYGLPTKSLKRLQNQYSIVFHECNGTLPILYLGDVPSDIFSKNIKTIIEYNKYKYIKAAHHGTKAYFTRDLPECETIIISSGKKNNCDITAMYPLLYSNQKFVCTSNEYCEYYNAKTDFKKNNIPLSCQQICGFNGIKKVLE